MQMTHSKERFFKPARPDDVFRTLKYAGPPKTIEEMDACVLAEAERRYASWSKDEEDENDSA
jgi:hypothetical protein